MSGDDLKQCPLWAEDIKSEAVQCRQMFCTQGSRIRAQGVRLVIASSVISLATLFLSEPAQSLTPERIEELRKEVLRDREQMTRPLVVGETCFIYHDTVGAARDADLDELAGVFCDEINNRHHELGSPPFAERMRGLVASSGGKFLSLAEGTRVQLLQYDKNGRVPCKIKVLIGAQSGLVCFISGGELRHIDPKASAAQSASHTPEEMAEIRRQYVLSELGPTKQVQDAITEDRFNEHWLKLQEDDVAPRPRTFTNIEYRQWLYDRLTDFSVARLSEKFNEANEPSEESFLHDAIKSRLHQKISTPELCDLVEHLPQARDLAMMSLNLLNYRAKQSWPESTVLALESYMVAFPESSDVSKMCQLMIYNKKEQQRSAPAVEAFPAKEYGVVGRLTEELIQAALREPTNDDAIRKTVEEFKNLSKPSSHDPELAEKLLDQSLQKREHDPKAALVLGQQAYDEDAANPNIVRNIAACELKLDRNQSAIKHLNDALALDPTEPRAWSLLGVAFVWVGDSRRGQACWLLSFRFSSAEGKRTVLKNLSSFVNNGGDESEPARMVLLRLAEEHEQNGKRSDR